MMGTACPSFIYSWACTTLIALKMTVNGLQLLHMETMAVVQTVPAPVDGELVGFDPVTDSLYFVGREDGRLLVWPISNLQN